MSDAFRRGFAEGCATGLIIAAIWFFGWLVGSAAAWDVNPGHWDGAGRAFDVAACTVLSIAAYADMRSKL